METSAPSHKTRNEKKYTESLRYFNIIPEPSNSTFNNMAYFTQCSDWFASTKFLNKLIIGYFRQNNVNMTDISTIVAEYCFIKSNPSFTMKTSGKTLFTLFLPTNDADDNQSPDSSMFFNNQILKISIQSNQNISFAHLGLFGIRKQHTKDLLDTINCMKNNKLYFGMFAKTLLALIVCVFRNLFYIHKNTFYIRDRIIAFCCNYIHVPHTIYICIDYKSDDSTYRHECQRSNWPAYYFFGGRCMSGYICPYENVAKQLFEKIPSHVFRMEDDDRRNIKSNTKMMYIRVDNGWVSLSSVRYNNLEDDFDFDDDDYNSKTVKPVEHILTLDVASKKVTFSIKKVNEEDADTVKINDQHQLKYEYSHGYFDIDSEYTYFPFVEGSDDYNIIFHDN